MNGNAIAVIEKPIVVIAMLASEKLRSPEEPQRQQRLARVVRLPPHEAPSTSSPVAMSSGTEMDPVMVPQS